MTRTEVLRAILGADTREQVTKARQLRNAWIRLHPDDEQIFEASEMLEMTAGALDMPEEPIEDSPATQ